jgi:hypothetical protein
VKKLVTELQMLSTVNLLNINFCTTIMILNILQYNYLNKSSKALLPYISGPYSKCCQCHPHLTGSYTWIHPTVFFFLDHGKLTNISLGGATVILP